MARPSEERATQVCRETSTEFLRMKKFENMLPRYRIMLVKESEDTFTNYPKFQGSRELFESFHQEHAAQVIAILAYLSLPGQDFNCFT
jgi:hypothetical protein